MTWEIIYFKYNKKTQALLWDFGKLYCSIPRIETLEMEKVSLHKKQGLNLYL